MVVGDIQPASATVDDLAVDLLDYVTTQNANSADAVAQMEITNTKSFELPVTGGSGLYMITVMGVLAGYFGGIVDTVIMRIADMMISFPGMVLAIAVAGILGASITNAIIAIAAVSWTKYARLARSLVLKIRHKDYVYAAILTGSKTPYMLVRYMLPNAIPMLVITAATDIGSMMLELAGLSFLGFGAQPPLAEWGLMLNEGRVYMQNAPWCMLAPGVAIFIVVVVFNLLGDSLRDVLDPRDE